MQITKEKAIKFLEKYPHQNPAIKSFYSAFIEGKPQPRHYLGMFRMYQGFSDAGVLEYDDIVAYLPSRKGKGNADLTVYELMNESLGHKDGFKAKWETIGVINGYLEGVVEDGFIKDEKLISEIKQFMARKWGCAQSAITYEHFAAKDEVKLISTMLDTVVDYLKTAYSLE